jgi:hypothetical protein
MLKDAKAGRMFALLHQDVPVAQIARTLNMGERTIRKYRDKGILPSQEPRPPRTYRTRTDPLEAYWPEVEAFLDADPRLKPVALLDWLKLKYNDAETGEGPITDSIRRTLERRVQKWKLDHQVQKEVTFPQVHDAGDVIAFDFVNLNGLGVTTGGQPYDHLLFHSVFTYSNWEHVHLCHSESFEALSAGLQDALHLAGGVPRRVRSDSLSAAVNNLSSDKQFARQYQALLDHFRASSREIRLPLKNQTQFVFREQPVRRPGTRRSDPPRPSGTLVSRPMFGTLAEAAGSRQRTHRLSACDRQFDSKARRVPQVQIRESPLSHDPLPHGLRSTGESKRGKICNQTVSENPACGQARRLGRCR